MSDRVTSKSLAGPIICVALLIISLLAPAAEAEFEEFGLQSFSGSTSHTTAGEASDFSTRFTLKHRINQAGQHFANARLESAAVLLPPGLIGNPLVVPRCETGALVAGGKCPIDSQVGIARVLLNERTDEGYAPLFNLAPVHPDREVARLGFYVGVAPVFIDITVRSAGDYGVTATVHDAPGIEPVLSSTVTIWGNPADQIHDEQRITTEEAHECPLETACQAPGGRRASGIEHPQAFITNPSACQEQSLHLDATSYQLPGQVFSASAPMAPITGCQGLPFQPRLELETTSKKAGAPTGLEATVHIPQHSDPGERASATMREALVTLPEGMTINTAAAQGLEVCSDQQVHYHEEVEAACPEASQLGVAEIISPSLSVPLHGEIVLGTPSPGHQFRLWLVTDELGLHVKLPGEVVGDSRTGQLRARFADLPQLPVETVSLEFWGGPRAPLKNPDDCGAYTGAFEFDPWSDDPHATGSATVTVSEGCGAAFSPKLQAGVTDPRAGAFAPFNFTLTREDGESNVKGLDVELPQGLLAKLKGVPICPDLGASTGICPAGSRIGTAVVASGVGPEPLWIPQPGKPDTAVYLGGPYGAAPFSIVTVVFAQAGPFDLGMVTVRSGIFVNPETGEASVKTELPQVVEGATVLYRTIHVAIDRPDFILNPTDCSPMAVTATATALSGAVARPSTYFQVGGCDRLKFAPSLSLTLKGPTRRGGYPALSAILRTRKHDANIARTVVNLPHSEFLAQEHIRTICTRKRFAADHCPKRSIYGFAKAWTSLLSEPLEGPVYLRSSDHPLPDLVAALSGQIDIDLVGRINSHNGGIRTTFASIPDAPVTKFVLRMQGGTNGLLVNSTDLCAKARRAGVTMRAQNGRTRAMRPALTGSCGSRGAAAG
jgi:hypothetical protein